MNARQGACSRRDVRRQSGTRAGAQDEAGFRALGRLMRRLLLEDRLAEEDGRRQSYREYQRNGDRGDAAQVGARIGAREHARAAAEGGQAAGRSRTRRARRVAVRAAPRRASRPWRRPGHCCLDRCPRGGSRRLRRSALLFRPAPSTSEIGRRWIVTSRSASVGRMRDARRALANAASCVVTTPASRPPANGSQPTTTCSPGGRTRLPARRTSVPGLRATTPIGEATAVAAREMIRASPAIIRRTCRGLLPMARKRASSRCRCCTESANVLATTKIATNAAIRAKLVSPVIASSLLECSLRRLRLAALRARDHAQPGEGRAAATRPATSWALAPRCEHDGDQVGAIARGPRVAPRRRRGRRRALRARCRGPPAKRRCRPP